MNRPQTNATFDGDRVAAALWDHMAVIRRFIGRAAAGEDLSLDDLSDAARAYAAVQAGLAGVSVPRQRELLEAGRSGGGGRAGHRAGDRVQLGGGNRPAGGVSSGSKSTTESMTTTE